MIDTHVRKKNYILFCAQHIAANDFARKIYESYLFTLFRVLYMENKEF